MKYNLLLNTCEVKDMSTEMSYRRALCSSDVKQFQSMQGSNSIERKA